MGLDNFNIAPDNKGGRKPKEEKDGKRALRSGEGRSYVRDQSRGEEWWLEVLSGALGRESINGDTIEDMENDISVLADYIHTNPLLVWKKLDEHGFIDMDWDEYREYYTDRLMDARVPGGPEVTGGGTSTTFGSNSLDEDSGLAAVINDAK